jgi:DNA invertase Pin-like site-specific DNA recombinase
MIAAIYARKSTDQNLPDAEKSVTRQVEHATAYATRKGWTVDPADVYTDDGISGGGVREAPGFLRLMAALTPHAPFEVLILSEPSRLGREQIETAYAVKAAPRCRRADSLLAGRQAARGRERARQGDAFPDDVRLGS